MDSQERPGRLLELVGIAALSLASFSYIASCWASEYSATRGTVISSWVTDLAGKRIENSQHAKSRLYSCVCYRYEVGGEIYNRQAHTEILNNEDCENTARAFSPGKNLIVCYNPADPYQSEIWQEIPLNELFLLLLGVGAYLLAFLCRKFESVAIFFGDTWEYPECNFVAQDTQEASFS